MTPSAACETRNPPPLRLPFLLPSTGPSRRSPIKNIVGTNLPRSGKCSTKKPECRPSSASTKRRTTIRSPRPSVVPSNTDLAKRKAKNRGPSDKRLPSSEHDRPGRILVPRPTPRPSFPSCTWERKPPFPAVGLPSPSPSPTTIAASQSVPLGTKESHYPAYMQRGKRLISFIV